MAKILPKMAPYTNVTIIAQALVKKAINPRHYPMMVKVPQGTTIGPKMAIIPNG